MFVISSRYTDVQPVFSQRPFQIHINKTKHCVDMTWYSCPGPVLARIISLPLQCSTWYRRPSWRCWTCKGLRWDVATSTSKTSEVVLLLQLMLSICWSLERATSTNTLQRRQSFTFKVVWEQMQRRHHSSSAYSGRVSSYTEFISVSVLAKFRRKTLLQRRASRVV